MVYVNLPHHIRSSADPHHYSTHMHTHAQTQQFAFGYWFPVYQLPRLSTVPVQVSGMMTSMWLYYCCDDCRDRSDAFGCRQNCSPPLFLHRIIRIEFSWAVTHNHCTCYIHRNASTLIYGYDHGAKMVDQFKWSGVRVIPSRLHHFHPFHPYTHGWKNRGSMCAMWHDRQSTQNSCGWYTEGDCQLDNEIRMRSFRQNDSFPIIRWSRNTGLVAMRNRRWTQLFPASLIRSVNLGGRVEQ